MKMKLSEMPKQERFFQRLRRSPKHGMVFFRTGVYKTPASIAELEKAAEKAIWLVLHPRPFTLIHKLTIQSSWLFFSYNTIIIAFLFFSYPRFTAIYDAATQRLYVSVIKAKFLPSRPKNGGPRDPFIKVSERWKSRKDHRSHTHLPSSFSHADTRGHMLRRFSCNETKSRR